MTRIMGVKKVYLLLPWQCYNQFNMRRYSKKKVADSTEQVSMEDILYSALSSLLSEEWTHNHNFVFLIQLCLAEQTLPRGGLSDVSH